MKAVKAAVGRILSPRLRGVISAELLKVDTSGLSDRKSETYELSPREYIDSVIRDLVDENPPVDTLCDAPSDTPCDTHSDGVSRSGPLTHALANANANALANAPANAFPHFDTFWQLYPRKVGKDDARKAFIVAAKKADPSLIIAGASRYAADPNLPTDKTYIPYPGKWLRGGHWDDEPLPQRQPEAIDRRQQATDDLFAAAARRMGVTPQPLHNHLTIEGTIA